MGWQYRIPDEDWSVPANAVLEHSGTGAKIKAHLGLKGIQLRRGSRSLRLSSVKPPSPAAPFIPSSAHFDYQALPFKSEPGVAPHGIRPGIADDPQAMQWDSFCMTRLAVDPKPSTHDPHKTPPSCDIPSDSG